MASGYFCGLSAVHLGGQPAEKRLAPIVGNDRYRYVAPLKTAANDARAVDSVLRDLRDFEFVAFHAPSRFAPKVERHVIRRLQTVAAAGIPVVVHPDVIVTLEAWASFEEMLLIENMDKRKPAGTTAEDLKVLFQRFPKAGLCFDLGHSRQVDPTMTEAQIILERFVGRLREVHISDVNTGSRHDPLSIFAMSAFRSLSALIPESTPVVLETLIDRGQSDILTEIDRARRRALNPTCIPAAEQERSLSV